MHLYKEKRVDIQLLYKITLERLDEVRRARVDAKLRGWDARVALCSGEIVSLKWTLEMIELNFNVKKEGE